MKIFLSIVFSGLLSFSLQVANAHEMPVVIFETSAGNIEIEVNNEKAPNTAKYFLKLIDQGKFNNTSFYRSGPDVKHGAPQFIEGGLLAKFILNSQVTSIEETSLPILDNYETTEKSGLKHQVATVSLARDIVNTGNGLPDIFICLEDIPTFDEGGKTIPDTRGFPAFAKVIKGLDIVQLIANKARNGETHVKQLQGQILTNPVIIMRAYRSN